MSSPPKQRRSAAELRSLILEAGLTILYERGLRATASHVPMTEALVELERTHGLEVGMGSIFGASRLWPTVKEFQLELLLSALADRSGEGPNKQSISLAGFIPDVRDQPLAERMELLVDLSRSAGLMNGLVPDPTEGRNWLIWVSIWATAMADSEFGELLVPRLREGEDVSTKAFAALYTVMLERLGLRLRPPYTIGQFTALVAAITDGITLRSGVMPEVVAHSPSRHPGEWNLLGTGFAAIALEFLEDDV